MEDKMETTLAAGCDDFGRKPFKEEEIFDRMAQHLGVRYVYEELDEKIEARVEITAADLAELSADWIAELRQAAMGDQDKKILSLIDNIQPQHPKIAEQLTVLVNQFQFDRIVELVKKI
jgi:hypothetical protein